MTKERAYYVAISRPPWGGCEVVASRRRDGLPASIHNLKTIYATSARAAIRKSSLRHGCRKKKRG